MKFAFLCIVISISCSVSVQAYPQFYTGLKYGPAPVRRTVLADTEDDSPVYSDPYRGWLWQKGDDYGDGDHADNLRKLPDFDFDLREILRGGKQGLTRNDDRDQRMRYYPKQRIREAYDQYRNFGNLGKLGLKFDVPHPYRHRTTNSQMLDDVRPYPPENEDITFKEDDEDDEPITPKKYIFNEETLDEKIAEANTRKYLEQMEKVLNKVEDGMHHEDMVYGHDGMNMEEEGSTDDFSIGPLKDVEFAKDKNEFAYAPSDPRFYVKEDRLTLKANPEQKTFPLFPLSNEESIGKVKEVSPDNMLNIKQRSDKHRESFTDNVMSTDVLQEPEVVIRPSEESPRVYVIAIVAGISAAASVGLIAVGIGWYNLQKHVKNASDVEYPAYGVTGPNKDSSPSGDRRLAQSAQMYHYQHQKQQILAMENRATATDRHGSVSEADSEEENEEGDYTVYECPGLAPTGEMEVKNPMFQDDPTPAQTPQIKTNNSEEKK